MKSMRWFRPIWASALALGMTAGVHAADKKEIRVDGFPDYDNHFKIVVPEFMKANPDLNVKFLINNHDDHHKKLTNNLATGSGAGDVVLVDVGRLGAFINAGGFVNLSEAPYNADKMATQFAPYAWAQGKGGDGKQ